MTKDKLNLMTAINKLSYGLVGCNILKALVEENVEISLFPINSVGQDADFQFHNIISDTTRNALSFSSAPCLRVWHQFNMAESIGSGERWGMPIFELDNFTKLEMHQLNSLDEIFVCSEWAKTVCSKLQSDVYTIPLGVDPEIFYQQTIRKPKDTIFLNIGKWEYRKGHDVLVECFNNAFKPSDNVQLWMCTFNSHDDNERWVKLYKESPLGDKIKIIPRLENQIQVAQVMNSATCGIFPSRAEGFNLGALEMLACGKPNIITNYSAHTEYSTKLNSFLIPIDSLEVADDGRWFKPHPDGLVNQGQWAKIEKSHKDIIIQYMRDIHHNGIDSQQTEHCLETARKFTWKNTAKLIIERIQA